jgi:hypothetical protein
MLRVNYLPPERMPSHQRDFPPREPHERLFGHRLPHSLALMVASYFIAMGVGVLLLGYLTAPVQRHASTATAISR